MILPVGVVSKKDMGVCSILFNMPSCRCPEARTILFAHRSEYDRMHRPKIYDFIMNCSILPLRLCDDKPILYK